MYKAYVFDMDGTLGDTLPLCIAAIRRAVSAQAGREYADHEITAHFGKTEEGIIETLVPGRYREGLDAYRRFYGEMLDELCPRPFPGIVRALDALRARGAILAVVTGKGPDSAAYTLKKYGLDRYFGDVEVGSPVRPNKTECMERVLARHGLRPSEAVYVGDVPSDVTAARKAGMAAWSAAWSAGAEPEKLAAEKPDMLFRSVEEFVRHIEAMDRA